MVYFTECGEWAELSSEQFERINKEGYIPKKNKDFIKLVSRLEYSDDWSSTHLLCMVRYCGMVLCRLETDEMMLRSLLSLSAINMGLALYAGFFIPPEYHTEFALPIRDYFLLSSVSFCLALYCFVKKTSWHFLRDVLIYKHASIKKGNLCT